MNRRLDILFLVDILPTRRHFFRPENCLCICAMPRWVSNEGRPTEVSFASLSYTFISWLFWYLRSIFDKSKDQFMTKISQLPFYQQKKTAYSSFVNSFLWLKIFCFFITKRLAHISNIRAERSLSVQCRLSIVEGTGSRICMIENSCDTSPPLSSPNLSMSQCLLS